MCCRCAVQSLVSCPFEWQHVCRAYSPRFVASGTVLSDLALSYTPSVLACSGDCTNIQLCLLAPSRVDSLGCSMLDGVASCTERFLGGHFAFGTEGFEGQAKCSGILAWS
jgi:hypothetical protein